MKRCILTVMFFCLLCVSAYADVTTDTSTTITAVRVESKWGFISYAAPIADESCSGNRVYIDLTDETDRVAYTTALAAFFAQKSVKIRAVSDGVKVFGACLLYDIYVY